VELKELIAFDVPVKAPGVHVEELIVGQQGVEFIGKYL
jgi:hypothetical protein